MGLDHKFITIQVIKQIKIGTNDEPFNMSIIFLKYVS